MLGSAPHSLEDTVATTSVPWRNNERLDFVAIFDGHGGATVSLYCQSHFYEEFENQLKEVAQIEDEVLFCLVFGLFFYLFVSRKPPLLLP